MERKTKINSEYTRDRSMSFLERVRNDRNGVNGCEYAPELAKYLEAQALNIQEFYDAYKESISATVRNNPLVTENPFTYVHGVPNECMNELERITLDELIRAKNAIFIKRHERTEKNIPKLRQLNTPGLFYDEYTITPEIKGLGEFMGTGPKHQTLIFKAGKPAGSIMMTGAYLHPGSPPSFQDEGHARYLVRRKEIIIDGKKIETEYDDFDAFILYHYDPKSLLYMPLDNEGIRETWENSIVTELNPNLRAIVDHREKISKMLEKNKGITAKTVNDLVALRKEYENAGAPRSVLDKIINLLLKI